MSMTRCTGVIPVLGTMRASRGWWMSLRTGIELVLKGGSKRSFQEGVPKRSLGTREGGGVWGRGGRSLGTRGQEPSRASRVAIFIGERKRDIHLFVGEKTVRHG